MPRIIKLYHPLALAGLLFLALSFFSFEQTLDIHAADTYYVIAGSYLFRKLAIILLSIAVLYRFTGPLLLSVYLSRTHVILTLISAALLAGAVFRGNRHAFGDLATRESSWQPGNMINLAIVVLVAGVLIYIINLLAGVIRRLL